DAGRAGAGEVQRDPDRGPAAGVYGGADGGHRAVGGAERGGGRRGRDGRGPGGGGGVVLRGFWCGGWGCGEPAGPGGGAAAGEVGEPGQRAVYVAGGRDGEFQGGVRGGEPAAGECAGGVAGVGCAGARDGGA